MRAPPVTLLQSFVAALALIALLLVALVTLVLEGARRSILSSAEKLRDASARRVESQVGAQLDGASAAVSELRREIELGLLQPVEGRGVEAALFRQVVRNPSLAEVTFVHAERTGYDVDGSPRLAPSGRWQVSVSPC